MDKETAERIGKKSRALKHCEKILDQVDKHGSHKVILNNTGVEFIVHKDDAIYLRIQSTRCRLLEEIHLIEVSERVKVQPTIPVRRTAPAPVGASALSAEELSDIQRAKRREYNRRYYEKKRKEKKN